MDSGPYHVLTVLQTFSGKFGFAVLAIGLLFVAAVISGCNTNSGGPPVTYTIGGSVINLAGTGGGLVLQDNQNDTVAVNANGMFVFPTAVANGSAYSVTIATQPSNPAQTCGVTNGSGTASENVTDIQVNCAHNEWTWVAGTNEASTTGVCGALGVTAMTNIPGGRYGAVTWADSFGNLWMFGGQGYDCMGNFLALNDLWKFSSGQWTWMGGPGVGNQSGVYGSLGVPGSANTPGGRYDAVVWADTSGNVWLFGGTGFDSAGHASYLNDLWKYSSGEWTWISGSDLAGQQGSYGTKNVPATGNVPGARSGAVGWRDSEGNLWMFGGWGPDSSGANGELNDLWEYSDGEWTWVSGSDLGRQYGAYGSQKVAGPENSPGARYWATAWTDSNGNFWMFGGAGYGATGGESWLSDLWKYSSGEWTWIAGPSASLQGGTYGTEGIAAPTNNPGARQEAIGWIDSNENLWLFGGNGVDSAHGSGLMSDLWRYSSGEWTWMAGSNLVNQSGTYGTKGVPFPGNVPGARIGEFGWIDRQGNLWLFSGYGAVSGTEGYLNDLWMYTP